MFKLRMCPSVVIPYLKCRSCNMHVYMDLYECLVIHECYMHVEYMIQ